MGVAGKAGLALLAAGVVTGAFLLGRQSSRSGVEPPPAASPSPPPAVQPAVVAPAAPTVTETAPPQRVPEPKRPAPAVAPPAITAPRPTSPPPDEDADYELLHQAMQSPSAEEKLRLAEAHGARFPSSSLAQERDVLAIDALVKLGRTSEARTRFEAFAKRWPTSAHLVRLEHLLAP